MSNKRPGVVWVIGLECSGTHYFRDLLEAHGIEAQSSSFPYGLGSDARWPWPPQNVRCAVVMVRERTLRQWSLSRAGYATNRAEQFNDPEIAKRKIQSAVAAVPHAYISLEAIGEYGAEYLNRALRQIGLHLGERLAAPFTDPNLKYLPEDRR